MGSPDAQPEGWHMVLTPEETPHALCQNYVEIAKTDPPIFGGTFRRLSENGPSVRRRDALRHPGSSIGLIDRDRTGTARTDLFIEDRISVVPPTASTRIMGSSLENETEIEFNLAKCSVYIYII